MNLAPRVGFEPTTPWLTSLRLTEKRPRVADRLRPIGLAILRAKRDQCVHPTGSGRNTCRWRRNIFAFAPRSRLAAGSAIGRFCWLGGWARFRLYYLVMLVKVPSFILAANRRIDLALRANRAMNGVAMNTFTIDANNNITAFTSLDEARAAKIHNAEYFGSSQELTKLVASWPGTRPVEIWNSFAGVAPAKGKIAPPTCNRRIGTRADQGRGSRSLRSRCVGTVGLCSTGRGDTSGRRAGGLRRKFAPSLNPVSPGGRAGGASMKSGLDVTYAFDFRLATSSDGQPSTCVMRARVTRRWSKCLPLVACQAALLGSCMLRLPSPTPSPKDPARNG